MDQCHFFSHKSDEKFSLIASCKSDRSNFKKNLIWSENQGDKGWSKKLEENGCMELLLVRHIALFCTREITIC